MLNVARERSLAEQVRMLDVPFGHLAVWALGQHGFLLKGGQTVVIIDPYLSDSIAARGGDFQVAFARLAPIAVQPAALDMIDVLLLTHEHTDHCDPSTISQLLQASPRARVLGSYAVRNRLRTAGLDTERIAVMEVDQPLMLNAEITITAIPAAHYDHAVDAESRPAYLGFILGLNGVTLYHSGDTVMYPGLLERLQVQAIDIACLPINGRDWFREQAGLVGNLDFREAAELTVASGAKVLVPAHNDLFPSNRVNPAYLVDYLATNHPRQRVHFLQPGELYYYVAL